MGNPKRKPPATSTSAVQCLSTTTKSASRGLFLRAFAPAIGLPNPPRRLFQPPPDAGINGAVSASSPNSRGFALHTFMFIFRLFRQLRICEHCPDEAVRDSSSLVKERPPIYGEVARRGAY